jgi:hypothetical protein
MRTEEVSLVARHNLVAHVHGQMDRLQCVFSLSSSVHINCDKCAHVLYMCVCPRLGLWPGKLGSACRRGGQVML